MSRAEETRCDRTEQSLMFRFTKRIQPEHGSWNQAVVGLHSSCPVALGRLPILTEPQSSCQYNGIIIYIQNQTLTALWEPLFFLLMCQRWKGVVASYGCFSAFLFRPASKYSAPLKFMPSLDRPQPLLFRACCGPHSHSHSRKVLTLGSLSSCPPLFLSPYLVTPTATQIVHPRT